MCEWWSEIWLLLWCWYGLSSDGCVNGLRDLIRSRGGGGSSPRSLISLLVLNSDDDNGIAGMRK